LLATDIISEIVFATGMGEVPEWLLFDQQDVHDTLVATSKHKPHLIADMAAMANVPGLANGQARRPVVLQTQHYASQVCLLHCSVMFDLTDLTASLTFASFQMVVAVMCVVCCVEVLLLG